MTLIDLRVEYKFKSGDSGTPLTNEHYDDVHYILWLEEELVKLKNLHKKLIPWEPLTNKT